MAHLLIVKPNNASLLMQIPLSINMTCCGGAFSMLQECRNNPMQFSILFGFIEDCHDMKKAQQPLRLLGFDSVPPRGLEPRTR